MKNNHLVQAWLILTLAITFGGALAAIELFLGPKIAENKKNEMLNQVPSLVENSEDVKTVEIDEGLSGLYKKPVAKALNAKGEILGYVIVASGDGFADKIELLIGVNVQADEITGIYVLSQKETPELGNKIVKSDFRDQFRGKLPNISANKKPQGEHQVKAISGATISSVAVCDIINKGIANFKKVITARTQEGNKKNGE